MKKGTGILLDPETGDLSINVVKDSAGLILSGLPIGNSTNQNQACLLNISPGELKADPLIGVGITDIVLDESNMLYWRTKVRQAFEQVGLKIKMLVFDRPTEYLIDAEYN